MLWRCGGLSLCVGGRAVPGVHDRDPHPWATEKVSVCGLGRGQGQGQGAAAHDPWPGQGPWRPRWPRWETHKEGGGGHCKQEHLLQDMGSAVGLKGGYGGMCSDIGAVPRYQPLHGRAAGFEVQRGLGFRVGTEGHSAPRRVAVRSSVSVVLGRCLPITAPRRLMPMLGGPGMAWPHFGVSVYQSVSVVLVWDNEGGGDAGGGGMGHGQGMRLTLGVPKWACLGGGGVVWKTRREEAGAPRWAPRTWSGPLGGPTGA